jgi:glycosyltransferase involved in cell wall biosynthesis
MQKAGRNIRGVARQGPGRLLQTRKQGSSFAEAEDAMRLDIVIPAYNEQDRIGPTLEAYRATCTDPETRFLVALDRCTDGTSDVVSRHAEADPRVRLLEFPKLGKGGVIMEAFRHCEGDLIGFVDADCATPPAELLRIAEAGQSAGAAIASRHHPAAVLPASRPATRKLTSAGFAFFVRRLFGLPFGDTQCGAKVFRREVIAEALPLLSSRDFLFDVDVLVVVRELGHRIAEVPTIWIERDGSRVQAVSDGRRMAASALRLWLHHRVLPVHGARTQPDRGRMPERARVAT